MQLDEALHHVEGQVQLMAAAMAGQDGAPSTQAAVELLRDCMVAFAGLARGYGPEQFTEQARLRMQAISDTLALQREFLVRMGAVTAQQVQTVVPQQRDDHTYGDVHTALPQGARASVSKLYHISG